MQSKISVVVINRNEGRELKRTVENLDDTLRRVAKSLSWMMAPRTGRRHGGPAARPIRMKRVEDIGVARARNLGASMAKGDIIVYADAHIRTEPYWWRPLAELLENPKVGGAAGDGEIIDRSTRVGYGLAFRDAALEVRWRRRKPSGPIALPILPGCCFATRRDVIEATGGWDDRQLRRGNVDNEGCVRFWLLGYELMVTPETVVKHKFRKPSPYRVHWSEFLFNRPADRVRPFQSRAVGQSGRRAARIPSIRRGVGAWSRRATPRIVAAISKKDALEMTIGTTNVLRLRNSPHGQFR